MSKHCFGVDIGGTTIKMGLFTQECTLVEKWEIPTDKTDSGKNILIDVAKAIENKMTEKNITKEDIVGIGIGVPGPVNRDNVGIFFLYLFYGFFCYCISIAVLFFFFLVFLLSTFFRIRNCKYECVYNQQEFRKQECYYKIHNLSVFICIQ